MIKIAEMIKKAKEEGYNEQALLQLLFEGPQWQYDRFIEYNVEWNSK